MQKIWPIFLLTVLFVGKILVFAQEKQLPMESDNRRHIEIELDATIELDLVVSEPFKFSDFKIKKGLIPFKPIYSNWAENLIFSKSCEIYIGEFAKHTGIMVENPPLESRYVIFKKLTNEVLTLSQAKIILSQQKGYSKNFEIKIEKNQKGVEIAIADFGMVGGASYYYTLIMGKSPVLISNSYWVDRDSIVMK